MGSAEQPRRTLRPVRPDLRAREPLEAERGATPVAQRGEQAQAIAQKLAAARILALSTRDVPQTPQRIGDLMDVAAPLCQGKALLIRRGCLAVLSPF